MIHAFYVMPVITSVAGDAIDESTEFLREAFDN